MTNTLLIISLQSAGRRAMRVDGRDLDSRRDNALLQEDRAIFLDARQWLGESSASLGRSGTKRRRTGRTATAFEMQSSSQDGT
jgi:hypothetical protein